MKPAPPKRDNLKPRPLRSLYADTTATVKRDAITTKLPCRKTTFKPPPVSVRLNKSVIQPGTIRSRTEAGSNRKDSVKMIRTITSKAGGKQCPQMNGFFLRPSIDIRSARQRFLERAKRMEDLLKSDGGNSKISNQTLMSPAIPCTPKPSGLSLAFIKLSNYKNKTSALEKGTLTPSLKERIIQKKINFDVNAMDSINLENRSNVDSLSLSKQKLSDKENISISNTNNFIKNCMTNNEKDRTTSDDKIEHYSLKNVLHHMQSYFGKMLNLNNEMNLLDGKFQSVMIAEMGNQVYEKFSNYQSEKKELYRKMELLENELENSVKNELDVGSKFKEYLTKKRNVLKERTNLQENCEKSLKEMIEEYENESRKPAKCENLEEIIQSIITSDKTKSDKVVEPILRRSKRLMATPKIYVEEMKSPGEHMKRKNSKKKEEIAKIENNDELIVKRDRKSCDRKRLQMNMYKDLQKSFNLCSPECSF